MENEKKYKIIYADPAWEYDDKSKSHGGGAESHYSCSSVEEMGKIDVPADEDSICLMWVTYPMLPEGLKLMKMWKFEFKTVAFTWVKTNKNSADFFLGMGRYTRGNPEVCLLGRRGKGVPRIDAGVPNLQIHKRREHSRKPDAIRNEIIRLFGDVPKIEMFARHGFEGWDPWGDEKPKDKQQMLSNTKGSKNA